MLPTTVSLRAITAGFIVMLALLVTLTTVGITYLDRLRTQLEQVTDDNMRNLDLVSRSRALGQMRTIHLYRMVFTQDPFARDEMFLELIDLAHEIGLARRALRLQPLSAKERDLFDRQRALLHVIEPAQDKAVDALTANDTDLARNILLREAAPLQTQLFALYDEMIEVQHRASARAVAEAKSEFSLATQVMLLAGLFAAIVGTLTTVYVIQHIARQRSELAQTLTELSHSREELEQRVEQRTAELTTARDEAMAAARAKASFLANMSHELRTPLNGLLGMIEVLTTTPLDTEQHDYVHTAQRSGRNLLELIDDILDLSKIEAGGMTLENATFDPAEMVTDALVLVATRARDKGLTLTSTGVDALPDAVWGDRTRLRQVLVNLLGNAVKFTDTGSVTLNVAVHADQIAFAVTDTGIGIDRQAQSGIFESFAQADVSTTRTHGGTGLGLAISAQLVAMMGGKLAVDSRPGQGSMFSFSIALPAADAAPQSQKRLSAPLRVNRERDAHILVAEDNEVNQHVIVAMLAKLGLTADLANDGEAAVQATRRRRYPVILMDCQMPVMDGYQATARIRELERDQGRRAAIIALTAHAMDDDVRRALASGMDDYLSKPVALATLANTLDEWLRGDDDGDASPISRTAPATQITEQISTLDGATINALYKSLGDPRSVVRLFGEETPKQISALREALASYDLEAVAGTSHTLKGSSSTLGASRLAASCAQLEAAAHRGDAAPRVAALIESVAQEFDSAYVALQAEITRSDSSHAAHG